MEYNRLLLIEDLYTLGICIDNQSKYIDVLSGKKEIKEDENNVKSDYSNDDIEKLLLLRDAFLMAILDYKPMGFPYPYGIEKLNYKTKEVLDEIGTNDLREKEREESNFIFQNSLSNNSDENYFEEDQYCDSCNQVPCMCSDQEKTSNTNYY